MEAAQALNPSTEDPIALEAAQDALQALLTTPQSLASKVAGLADLQSALQILDAAGGTDSYVPDAVAALAATRGVVLDARAIAGTLRGLQAQYTTAAPCITALLSRAARINSTVLQIPQELYRPVTLLQAAQVRECEASLKPLWLGWPWLAWAVHGCRAFLPAWAWASPLV